ncbi:TSN31 protein, partial [Bucorvus abyssinicus]|nr:TSN31 protein [Bucorvus abyssinicus]
QLVGLLLIGVAAWGKGFGLVSSIHIIGGVIAVGVFLLLIALVGLVGAVHHHQVMLFFVSFNLGQGAHMRPPHTRGPQTPPCSAWPLLSNATRLELERSLDCCGLLNRSADPPAARAFQADLSACPAVNPRGQCPTCGEKMLRHSDEALKILGGVGLFFSFTEILGVWLAMRYRNQKDPRANPS